VDKEIAELNPERIVFRVLPGQDGNAKLLIVSGDPGRKKDVDLLGRQGFRPHRQAEHRNEARPTASALPMGRLATSNFAMSCLAVCSLAREDSDQVMVRVWLDILNELNPTLIQNVSIRHFLAPLSSVVMTLSVSTRKRERKVRALAKPVNRR
jgi:hypothetical protein